MRLPSGVPGLQPVFDAIGGLRVTQSIAPARVGTIGLVAGCRRVRTLASAKVPVVATGRSTPRVIWLGHARLDRAPWHGLCRQYAVRPDAEPAQCLTC